MKRIYLHILVAVVVALTLTACGNEYIEPDSDNVAPIFTATIEGNKTRTIGSNWESDDEIGITCTSAGATNICYVTSDGSGRFEAKDSSQQIYYKSSSTSTSSWTFNAYYPWTPLTGTATTLPVMTSDQTKQKSFDFLFASVKGTKESPAVTFEFKHAMSMVSFVFKNGPGFNVSNIARYRLGTLNMNGTFNITTGTFSSTSLSNKDWASVELSDVKADEPVTPLILIPQSVSASLSFEIVSKDNQIFTVALSFPSNKLVAGENYKFTITVSKIGLSVSECTIEDWNDYNWPEGSSGEGTADSADDPEE